MEYILKNKDKEILEFSTKTQNGFVYLDQVKIINNELCPKEIKNLNNLKSNLHSWIENRKIPKHRQFAKNILQNLGVDSESNFLAYVDISFGLSLNDSLWIIPKNKDYKWADYNLYKNKFDTALQLCAFGINVEHNKSTSPEYTTNGMLKKCWIRKENEIFLFKGSMQGEEAFGEYFSYQVAKIMKFNAISYDLQEYHNNIVSSCPIFTNENRGFIPIGNLIEKEIKKGYKAILARHCENIYGKENFADLMVFDAIIGNIDRHLGNFGMIVDNNTSNFLQSAPIFDNGLCVLGWANKDEYLDIDLNQTYFDLNFKAQLEKYIDIRHLDGLKKLADFKFKQHSDFKFDENLLQIFNNFVNNQAKLGLKILKNLEQDLAQNAPKICKKR